MKFLTIVGHDGHSQEVFVLLVEVKLFEKYLPPRYLIHGLALEHLEAPGEFLTERLEAYQVHLEGRVDVGRCWGEDLHEFELLLLCRPR